jgi:hypothetical protein
MDLLSILAQTTQASQSAEYTETIVPLDAMWEHITSLRGFEALIMISFGSICLFYGWRIFKILVIISFSFLGLSAGWLFTERFVVGLDPLVGGVIGMAALGVASILLLKWAVCMLGTIAGGFLTASLWHAAGLSEQYIWAGALIGMVAGGMIAFIIFKIAIMLFTSLGGSFLIVTGILALLYLWPQTQENVHDWFFDKPWFLPLLIIIPTFAGLYIQNRFIKGSAEWSV